MNHYLYEYSTPAIWIKPLDGSPPREWLRIKGNDTHLGRTLKPALNSKALAINKDKKSILVVEVDEKGIMSNQIEIVNEYGQKIYDHKIFGEEGNHLALLTKEKWLVLYKFYLTGEEPDLIDRIRINSIEGREEYAFSLAVCPKHRFFAYHLSDNNHRASRLLIFELDKNNILRLRDEVDFLDSGLYRFFALSFYEYFGNHLLLTAITHHQSNPKVMTFDFNVSTLKLKEIKALRKTIDAVYVKKILKVEGGFIFSDSNANKFRIEYQG